MSLNNLIIKDSTMGHSEYNYNGLHFKPGRKAKKKKAPGTKFGPVCSPQRSAAWQLVSLTRT
jgi:hypothetical protein